MAPGLICQEGSRLHTPVDIVRARQRVQHLEHQVARLAGRQRAVLEQDLIEAPPRRELKHREQPAVVRLPRIDQPNDVRVLEPRAQVHLAPEPRHPVLAPGLRIVADRVHDLDRDRLVRGELDGLVDRAEPAGPERGHDLVATLQHRAGAKIVGFYHRDPAGRTGALPPRV